VIRCLIRGPTAPARLLKQSPNDTHWILVKSPSDPATTDRRRVDWPIILGPQAPVPRVLKQSPPGALADLQAAFDEVLALDDPDAILKQAVEIARQRIGLDRAGIFLVDRRRQLMLGTWGTDLRGRLNDERQIMYEIGPIDREAFRRGEQAGERFTVFDNCPIVEHSAGETRVVGHGWVVATPIRSARASIGILFNDAGLSGRAVDDVKQAHTGLLCSLLGTVLDPMRSVLASRSGTRIGIGVGVGVVGKKSESWDRLAAAAVAMLAKDPTMGGKEIAAKLDISLSRLTRVLKAELGMSLVEYRNRLRMERFSLLVDHGHTNLLGAALAAGFGSYAQFYRVFRALRRGTPREFLRARAC
jgi:AraC-like DNA-binding protein